MTSVDVAAPLTRQAEWSLVRFARALYFPDGPDGGWEPSRTVAIGRDGLSGSGAARPVFDSLLPVIAKGTWRFLARNGGYRRREVIAAGGRKRAGRLWDEAVWGNEPLKITGGTVLWLSAFHDAVAHWRTGVAGSALPGIPADDLPLTAGDRLALSVALLPLARETDGLDRIPESLLTLAARLPLLGLGWPRAITRAVDWPRVDLAESLVVQYSEHFLATNWVRLLNFRRRRSAAEQTAIDLSLLRAFDGLFEMAAGRDRDHLLGPLAAFFPLLWREGGGSAGLLEGIERVALLVPGQADREKLLHGFGSVLHAGVRLDARVTEIQNTPWADRTESQKRLAADYETGFRPIRDEVRGLARRLRRELG